MLPSGSMSCPAVSPFSNVILFCLVWFYFFIFLRFFFLMWIIFKVFIEFVTILLLFYVLDFWPQGMWDLSSLTRDRSCTPCTGRHSLNHWASGEVPQQHHFKWPHRILRSGAAHFFKKKSNLSLLGHLGCF